MLNICYQNMEKNVITTGIKATFFIVLFVACSGLNLFAQKTHHEFSITADGGFAAFCFQPAAKGSSSVELYKDIGTDFNGYNGVSSTGFTSGIGVGFTGFLSPHFGIHVGAGFGAYSIKTKVKELRTFTPELIDQDETLDYNLYTNLYGYKEIQKTLFVNFPVLFQYQTVQKQSWNWEQSQKRSFYAAAGINVLLLVNNKFESQVTSFHNAAYYLATKNWAATQSFKGFGTFAGSSNSGKFKTMVLAVFVFETGVKWRVDKNTYLYTGAFFNCGLNDGTKTMRQDYKNFTDPDALKDITLLGFSDRINLMAAGIKLRLALFADSNKSGFGR